MATLTADVVIVGGGVLGCSIAWHLKKITKASVVLLDGNALASQATSQAAGLVTRARTDGAVMALVSYTHQAIAELEELGGHSLVNRVGTLHIAASPQARERLDLLITTVAQAGTCIERVSPHEAGRLAPWLNEDSVEAAAFSPDDGFVDPYALATAYTNAARAIGVQVRVGTKVNGLLLSGGRISGVFTSNGEIQTSVVVLATGAWTNRLTWPCGVGLATAPVRSQYWITDPDPVFPRRHPVVILPDANAYTRPDLGALLIGLRERQSVSVDPRLLPEDASSFAFEGDPNGWNALTEAWDTLRCFLPAAERIGIRHHIAGLSTYTPDGRPILGTAGGIQGLLVASGCCGAGVAISGGVGFAIAELADGRAPSIDLQPFRSDRFGAIDPFDPQFRQRCAATRSNKSAG